MKCSRCNRTMCLRTHASSDLEIQEQVCSICQLINKFIVVRYTVRLALAVGQETNDYHSGKLDRCSRELSEEFFSSLNCLYSAGYAVSYNNMWKFLG